MLVFIARGEPAVGWCFSAEGLRKTHRQSVTSRQQRNREGKKNERKTYRHTHERRRFTTGTQLEVSIARHRSARSATAQQLVSSPLLKGGLLHFSFCYFIIFIYVYIFLVRWSSMLSVPILFEKLLLFSSSLFCRSALVSPSTILLWRMCTRRHSGFLFFFPCRFPYFIIDGMLSLSLFSLVGTFLSRLETLNGRIASILSLLSSQKNFEKEIERLTF